MNWILTPRVRAALIALAIAIAGAAVDLLTGWLGVV